MSVYVDSSQMCSNYIPRSTEVVVSRIIDLRTEASSRKFPVPNPHRMTSYPTTDITINKAGIRMLAVVAALVGVGVGGGSDGRLGAILGEALGS